jgi:hypothetical protein
MRDIIDPLVAGFPEKRRQSVRDSLERVLIRHEKVTGSLGDAASGTDRDLLVELTERLIIQALGFVEDSLNDLKRAKESGGLSAGQFTLCEELDQLLGVIGKAGTP